MMLILATRQTTHAASDTLGNFLDATASVIPNRLSLGANYEAKYNDNIHHDAKGRDKHGRWVFNTGLTADWFRNTSLLTYGLTGELDYDHYHRESGELSQFRYSLAPHIAGAIGVGMGDVYLNFTSTSDLAPLSSTDRRYARSYTNGLQAVWDIIDHDRWGTALTGDWEYVYYPGSEFKDNTRQTYGVSLAPYYKLSAKTKLGLRLGYEKTDYRNSKRHDDSDKVYLNAFTDYRVTQKLSMYGEAGLERQSYRGETKGTNTDRDVSPNGRLSVRYAPVSNFSLALSVYHALEQSYARDKRGLMKETTTSLTAAWAVNPKFLITQILKHTHQDEKESAQDINEYGYTLRADYYLFNNINLYSSYTYEHVHYIYDHNQCYAINEVLFGLSWSY